MRKKVKGGLALGSNPSWCYLCGFVIPTEIASSTHPLFGTVDHVIPLSRNGPNAPYNRLPAHRFCNMMKGRSMVNPEEFAVQLHVHIVPLLQRLGYAIAGKTQTKAMKRALGAWPSWAPKYRREGDGAALHRWENEGGR
jgi:hypothetical protein